MSNPLTTVRQHRPHRRIGRLRRALLGLFVVVLCATGMLVLPASPAAGVMSSRESGLADQFMGQLNAERAARGLAPLVYDPSIAVDAIDWAETMANRSSMVHSSDGRAEIIARGWRTGQISELWMISDPHRNLVVDPNLGYAGIGVACDSSGQMWAVVQFRRINTRLGTLTSSKASPRVTESNEGTGCGDVPVSTENSIRRLYQAYFLRKPDASGLAYWKGQSAAGVDIPVISDAFAQSAEFRNRYGKLSNRQFVRQVYQNVMGRAPDAAGESYWLAQLNRGMTRGQLMTNFSESPEYKTKTGLH